MVFLYEQWRKVLSDALRVSGHPEQVAQSDSEKAIAKLRVTEVLQKIVQRANAHSRKKKDGIDLREQLIQFTQSDIGNFKMKRNIDEFSIVDQDGNTAFVLSVYELNLSFGPSKGVTFVRRLEYIPTHEALGYTNARFFGADDFAEFLVKGFIYKPDKELHHAVPPDTNATSDFDDMHSHFAVYF